jgi:hypothetical protein
VVLPLPFCQAASWVCPAGSWRPRHADPELTSARRSSMVNPRGRRRLPLLGNPERPACQWPQPVLDIPKRLRARFVPADAHHPASVGRCHKPPALLGLRRLGSVACGTASIPFRTRVRSGMLAAAVERRILRHWLDLRHCVKAGRWSAERTWGRLVSFARGLVTAEVPANRQSKGERDRVDGSCQPAAVGQPALALELVGLRR